MTKMPWRTFRLRRLAAVFFWGKEKEDYKERFASYQRRRKQFCLRQLDFRVLGIAKKGCFGGMLCVICRGFSDRNIPGIFLRFLLGLKRKNIPNLSHPENYLKSHKAKKNCLIITDGRYQR
jgi:hypothetical protein